MIQENKKYYLLCELFDTDLINIIKLPGTLFVSSNLRNCTSELREVGFRHIQV